MSYHTTSPSLFPFPAVFPLVEPLEIWFPSLLIHFAHSCIITAFIFTFSTYQHCLYNACSNHCVISSTTFLHQVRQKKITNSSAPEWRDTVKSHTQAASYNKIQQIFNKRTVLMRKLGTIKITTSHKENHNQNDDKTGVLKPSTTPLTVHLVLIDCNQVVPITHSKKDTQREKF